MCLPDSIDPIAKAIEGERSIVERKLAMFDPCVYALEDAYRLIQKHPISSFDIANLNAIKDVLRRVLALQAE